MTEQGTIASVDATPLGSELVATAFDGDTTLQVADSSDFFETGGYLIVGGGVYKYTAVDGDADIITLAAPISLTPPTIVIDNLDGTFSLIPSVPVVDNGDGTITATLPDSSVSVDGAGVVTLNEMRVVGDPGMPVIVWDNSTQKPAVRHWAAVIAPLDDNVGDAMEANVAPGLAPYLPLGPRDDTNGEAEACTVETDDYGTLWVTSISGRSGTFSADFLATVPAPADGLPPGSSPTPTVTGGIGSLFITYTPVTNTTAVSYDIHVSATPGFVPSPADLVGTTAGSSFLCTALADGTPLTSVNTYYVAIVASDTDGSASPSAIVAGSPRTASGPDIDVNYVYAGTVLANQVNAGSVTTPLVLGASMKTAVTGARVELDAGGQRVYGPDGTMVSALGIDGSGYFSGTADVGILTAEGPAAFLGPIEVANGVTATLDNVFAPGANAPNCSCQWYYNANTGGFGGQAQEWTVLNYSAAASQMYAYIAHAFSGGKTLQVWAVDSTGAAGTSPLAASVHVASTYTLAGAGVIGSDHWFYIANGANARWLNNSTGASTAVDTSNPYLGSAAGTSDGTNLWTVNTSGAAMVVKKWDPTNLSAPLTTTNIAKPSGFSACWGMYVGAGDFGTPQIGLSIETTDGHGHVNARRMLWYNTGGIALVNNTFNVVAGGSNSGLAYDGTRFWNSNFFSIIRYEGGTHKLIGASATWYSSYTWRDDGHGYETVMSSTPRPFTMQSRAYVVMNGMGIPAGADHLGFYLGPAAARTSQWLQGESTGPSLTLLPAPDAPQDLVLSGTNPPAAGTFPTSAAPGQLVSGAVDGNGPLLQLKGDGSYRLAGTNVDDVAWTNLGNGSKYRVKNGVVYAYVNNGSFSTPNAIKTQVSTSAIPAAYRPSSGVYGAGYFAGGAYLVEVDTDGNLYALQNGGGTTTNITGMVSYPVGL